MYAVFRVTQNLSFVKCMQNYFIHKEKTESFAS